VGDGFLSQAVTPWPDAETRRRGADGPEPADERVGPRAGSVALLVLLVAVAAWAFFRSQIKAAADARQPQAVAVAQASQASFDELKAVPNDALTLLTWQPNTPDNLRLGEPDSLAQRLFKERGLRWNNQIGPVTRLTLVTQLPDKSTDPTADQKGAEKDVWLMVRTATPYNRMAVFQAMGTNDRPPAWTYNGITYFLVYPQRQAPLQKPPPPGRKKGKGQILQAPLPQGDEFQVVQGPLQPQVPKLQVLPKGNFPLGPRVALFNRIPAVYFASPHVFIIGDDVSIRRLLRGKRTWITGPQEQTVAQIKGRALVIGLNQKAATLKGTAPASAVNIPPLSAAFKQSVSAVVTVDAAQGKGGFSEDLQFTFANQNKAEEAQQSLLKWKAQQADRYAEARARIEAKQTEDALKAALRALGSVTPGRFSPVGGLIVVPQMRNAAVSKKDLAELARLKAEKAVTERMATPPVVGTTMSLNVRFPPGSADLARQMWASYAELAVNSLPVRRQSGAPPMKSPVMKKP
jgi:hypothetical protein